LIDFANIDYLKSGSLKQQSVFKVLTNTKILIKLSEFDALLAGTYPIDIPIENSDLDIICFWENKQAFTERLKQLFENEVSFKIRESTINEAETVIANFSSNGFAFEIFGQNIPVKNQNAYRHMIIEQKILEAKDESFRREIIELKQKGYKTEPAFAVLLGLKNDPYRELLHYKI